MLPESGFIHTVYHGPRNQEVADCFIGAIKAYSDGKAPLFLSDGWSSYEEILAKHYSTLVPLPYSGRGRPRHPIRVIDEDLKYAQVVKNKEAGKPGTVEKRIILGEEKAILEIIEKGGRGSTINTSYVESRNGNYRKDNKRLTRKTQCHSKKCLYHDAQIDFITAKYNFIDEVVAFRECINPEAKRFETKYRKRTPAMVQGLIDKKLSLEELLMMKLPPA